MDPFLPFIAATAVGATLAVIGYLVAKRAGLGPVQAEYVRNLEGNNRMLEQRIDELEGAQKRDREALTREQKTRVKLARRLIRLERTIVALAEENDYLRKRLNMPRRGVADGIADNDDEVEELIGEDGTV